MVAPVARARSGRFDSCCSEKLLSPNSTLNANRRPGMRSPTLAFRSACCAVMLVLAAAAPQASAAPAKNWTSFLHGPRHSSLARAATSITPSNAGNLVRVLHWQDPAALPGEPDPGLFAS